MHRRFDSVALLCREDARFLHKRLPEAVCREDSTIQAEFALLQRLWNRSYAAVWPALDHNWPDQLQGLAASLRFRLQGRVMALVERAYVDLSPARLAALMGCSQQDAQQGKEPLTASLHAGRCVIECMQDARF